VSVVSEPLPTDRAALIKRIKDVAFRPTRFRRGYDFRGLIAEAIQHVH